MKLYEYVTKRLTDLKDLQHDEKIQSLAVKYGQRIDINLTHHHRTGYTGGYVMVDLTGYDCEISHDRVIFRKGHAIIDDPSIYSDLSMEFED